MDNLLPDCHTPPLSVLHHLCQPPLTVLRAIQADAHATRGAKDRVQLAQPTLVQGPNANGVRYKGHADKTTARYTNSPRLTSKAAGQERARRKGTKCQVLVRLQDTVRARNHIPLLSTVRHPTT